MNDLKNLEPANVFRYFKEISDIPRGSGNTDGMTEYLIEFATSHNFDAVADEVGNVIIYKDASEGYEESPVTILQGHVDMVCAKTAESTHNFLTDPLDLKVEGDDLYAEGTTLGGDDGIACAYMLAILDDDSLAHPPLECVFTVDEEIGLKGAAHLNTEEMLQGKRMINIDSETEGILTAGCAGGIRVDSVLPTKRATIRGVPVLVEISGLKSGHSGDAIAKGRINANKLLGRYLYALDRKVAYSLSDVSGGDKDNAIPALAKAHIIIDEDDLANVKKFTRDFTADVKKEYAGTDDELKILLDTGHAHKVTVMDQDSQERVITFLNLIPNGALHMSAISPGLPQTSTNVGIMRTGNEQFVATSLVRSSLTSEKTAVVNKIRLLTEFLDGQILLKDEYPAWEFNENSALRDVMQKTYADMFGKEAKVEVIHGGLECGIFYGKIEGLDAVSFGPDIRDIHTPNEKLSISSAKRTWEYLLKVLEALK